MNGNPRKVSKRSATALFAMAAIAMMLFALVPAMAMPGPTSGTVTGTVTDAETGEPIEGATVTISYHGITRTDVTDANGVYSFNNVPLCYCLKNISVSMKGYEDQSRDVGVNKLTIVDFELEPTDGGDNKPNHGSITGTVTDTNNGEPIEGAKVVLEYHDILRTVVTGADGKYRFDDVPECFCLKNLTVTKDGYMPETEQVAISGETVVDFELLFMELEPHEGSVIGTVWDEEDKSPLQGARVVLEYHETIREVYTDANGEYYFGQVPECRCYKNVTVSMEGYLSETKAVSVLGETVVDFQLKADGGGGSNPYYGAITGTITDINDGEPIEGAKVVLEYHDVLRTEVTGTDGKYRFDDVPECFCLKSVTVTKDGYLPKTEEVAISGETIVDFQLIFMELEPFEGTVMGTVWDDHDRQPLEGARVELEYHGTVREVYTDADGEYRFDQVPECFCLKNVTVTLKGYLPETKQVAVSGETVVDFELMVEEQEPGPSMGKLSGVVTDADTGEPIEGALVTLEYHDITRTSLTDAKGGYVFTDVPICFCLKQVSAAKVGYATSSDAVGVNEDTWLALALEPESSDAPKEDPPVSPGEDDGPASGVVGDREGPMMSMGLAITMVGILGASALIGLVTFVILSRRSPGDRAD